MLIRSLGVAADEVRASVLVQRETPVCSEELTDFSLPALVCFAAGFWEVAVDVQVEVWDLETASQRTLIKRQAGGLRSILRAGRAARSRPRSTPPW